MSSSFMSAPAHGRLCAVNFSVEMPAQLQAKHELQAHVYADVQHKAGYELVGLRFVRVEVENLDGPGQPQVVEYEL